MEKWFRELPLKKFRTFVILFCVLGDIIVFAHIYQKFSDRSMFDRSLGLALELGKQSLPPAERAHFIMPKADAEAIYSLMTGSLKTLLILVMIFHWGIFTLFHLGKRPPWSYLRFYSLLAAPGCLVMALGSLNTLLGVLMLPAAAGYSFNTYGFFIKKFAKE